MRFFRVVARKPKQQQTHTKAAHKIAGRKVKVGRGLTKGKERREERSGGLRGPRVREREAAAVTTVRAMILLLWTRLLVLQAREEDLVK